MGMDLVVVRPFGTYRAGDRITDAAAMEKVLGSENKAHVVRTASLPGPPPAKEG
jgi:hypothetical protein